MPSVPLNAAAPPAPSTAPPNRNSDRLGWGSQTAKVVGSKPPISSPTPRVSSGRMCHLLVAAATRTPTANTSSTVNPVEDGVSSWNPRQQCRGETDEHAQHGEYNGDAGADAETAQRRGCRHELGTPQQARRAVNH